MTQSIYCIILALVWALVNEVIRFVAGVHGRDTFFLRFLSAAGFCALSVLAFCAMLHSYSLQPESEFFIGSKTSELKQTVWSIVVVALLWPCLVAFIEEWLWEKWRSSNSMFFYVSLVVEAFLFFR